MEINLQQRKTIITVIRQENLGDSLLGSKIVLTTGGTEKKGSLRLPWLEKQAAELVRANQSDVPCYRGPDGKR